MSSLEISRTSSSQSVALATLPSSRSSSRRQLRPMPGSIVTVSAVASAKVRTSGQKVLMGRGRDASVKSKKVRVWRTHTWCTFSSAAVSVRVTCRPLTSARTVAVAARAAESA